MVMPGGCEEDYKTCHCECHGDNQLQVKHRMPCCSLPPERGRRNV